MEHRFIDPLEMERRRDPDYIRSLDMIDEGAPVHYPKEGRITSRKESSGFDENELPRTYQ
ncbi:hypothetical protein QTL97_07160 [Sporosarcina thermotolerans]|uniref:Uncharacterized protein n=1 Tax=Sporosarcina thermotolerans TaxID=633404 RepID=A0AAW9A6T6_9BACL|nr:hypothetical protein [Sporosarcina thermotolerans]MDW0116709.1 hypothetical protein [Sporosarcina thermotolerans]WHT48901.1 hypothetical protein QNH10_04090 [Sporosarcina thermotolerans]